VFGGSFDPIHHGHLIAVGTLADALELDEVRLVVARRQPLKQDRHGAPAKDRAAMVELAVRGHPKLRVDRRELGREGPSYTVDSLRAIRAEWPGAELVLLLGTDAARELPSWREADAIRSLARVEVFGRDEAVAGALAVPRVEISSTAIRARVRAGRSIRYWVPDAVAEYIAAHRLYREE
jgi:nicotinate-nucleotide adenylyltransferase